MSLHEEIRDIVGKKRRFLLFRIADIDADTARKICKVPKGTYNTWTSNPHCRFVELYRRRDEFSGLYKQEAIQILRRDNQLAAVMLEEKIIQKMKDEVESGNYNLIRTNLARDVYTKLIGDLDYQPDIKSLTWEQRLQQLFVNGQPVNQLGGGYGQVTEGAVATLAEGEVVGEHQELKRLKHGTEESETAISESPEYQESGSITQGEPRDIPS